MKLNGNMHIMTVTWDMGAKCQVSRDGKYNDMRQEYFIESTGDTNNFSDKRYGNFLTALREWRIWPQRSGCLSGGIPEIQRCIVCFYGLIRPYKEGSLI